MIIVMWKDSFGEELMFFGGNRLQVISTAFTLEEK